MAQRTADCPVIVAAPLRLEAWSLRAAGADIRVQRTGIGPRRAQQAVARLRADRAPALAIAGLGGGLDTHGRPGDIIVAAALQAPDGTRRALDADPVVHALQQAGLPARAGVIASAATAVTGRERAALAATGACAVDMESFWLADGAAGRPLAVVRVILDDPHHELYRLDLPPRLVYCLRRLCAVAPMLAQWAAAETAAAGGEGDGGRTAAQGGGRSE